MSDNNVSQSGAPQQEEANDALMCWYVNIFAHICDSSVAGFLRGRGCVWAAVWDCCVGFSLYRKCVVWLFVFIFSSFPVPIICPPLSLDYTVLNLSPSVPPFVPHILPLHPFFSLIPPTPAERPSLPTPARRCVNMALRSSLICVAPSGTASSPCWRSSRSRFHPASTSPSSSNQTTSGRSREPTLAALSLSLRWVWENLWFLYCANKILS